MKTTWPTLPYDTWKETLDTLHLWVQIAGKIKLKQSPFLNQWWEVALSITPNGLTTGRIPYQDRSFEIFFNFTSHQIVISTNEGKVTIIPMKATTVAYFYEELMSSLRALDIKIKINTTPSEMPGYTIPFEKDIKHTSYEREPVEKWHEIQVKTSFILDTFRTNFRGKSSPTQFFWGSFDVNTSRYSGKKLPDKNDWPKGYRFMRYAENEENFSCGFWPGNKKFPKPAFYSYLYPLPAGCETIHTGAPFSYFDKNLAECILPYEDVIKTKNPEKEILHFFTTTYKAFAKLARWNITELKANIPKSFA